MARRGLLSLRLWTRSGASALPGAAEQSRRPDHRGLGSDRLDHRRRVVHPDRPRPRDNCPDCPQAEIGP